MPELWEPYGDVDASEWWTTRDGRCLRIAAMTIDHLRAALAWVARHPEVPSAVAERLRGEALARGLRLPTCRGTGSVRKPHNNNAGYVASRTNPATGCHTTLYVARAAGIDADSRYVVCCEAHGGLLEVSNRDAGYAWLRTETVEWCGGCQAPDASFP